jgi:hypothetical protein
MQCRVEPVSLANNQFNDLTSIFKILYWDPDSVHACCYRFTVHPRFVVPSRWKLICVVVKSMVPYMLAEVTGHTL